MLQFHELVEKLQRRDIPAHGDRQLFLLAGNGLSRLAFDPDRRSFAKGLGWRDWVARHFDLLSTDRAWWSYLERQGLTLPEGIQWICQQAKHQRDRLVDLYRELWEAVEVQSVPGPVHVAAVETFQVIFTTNYDTLFERAAIALGRRVRVWNLGATPDAKPRLHGVGGGAILDVVKLHGSFPFSGNSASPSPAVFDTWWADRGDEKLVATSKAYRFGLQPAFSKVDELFEDPRLLRQGPNVARGSFIAGHGLVSEDVLIAHVLTRLHDSVATSPIVLAFAPGTAERVRQSIDTADAPHEAGGGSGMNAPVVERGLRSRDLAARSRFYEAAFRTIQTGVAQKVDVPEPSQVLLVGQASINYVTRVNDGPLALERSYRVATRPGGKPANEIQVGGQALVPALLLDRWACRSALFTTIGYDDDGAGVLRELMGTRQIALEGLVQHKDVLTDRSYVVTYGDVRILIDSGTSNDEAVNSNQVPNEILPAIELSLDEAAADRRLLYLTKWFLHPIIPRVQAWREKVARLEVLFETGTHGFRTADEFEDCLRKLGPQIDILLSSSLFALRLLRPRMSLDAVASVVSVTGLESGGLVDWDSRYDEIEKRLAVVTRGRAIQNHVFVEALRDDPEAACALIRKHIRAETGRAVVTLGSAGAVVVPVQGPCYWIEAEAAIADANSSALGCGDTLRGALVGTLLREGVTTDATFELATRLGVHAGTTKFRHMRLTEALDMLASYEGVKLAGSALRKHDLRAPGTLEMLSSRVTL